MLTNTQIQQDLFSVHEHENNYESQKILDRNILRFSNDCRKVFNLLLAGGHYTIKELDVDRARITDLKKNGVQLSCWLNEERYKVWFMSAEDIKYNKAEFIK